MTDVHEHKQSIILRTALNSENIDYEDASQMTQLTMTSHQWLNLLNKETKRRKSNVYGIIFNGNVSMYT